MTVKYNLPVDYTKLSQKEKRAVREQYIKEQNNLCMFCKENLFADPPESITNKPIDWRAFPGGKYGFLKNSIHLQHCHNSNLTEGAVHAYCNATMWQYYGR
jgi:hypothetical protein